MNMYVTCLITKKIMSWPTVRIKCYLYLLQKQDNGGDFLWPSFLYGEEGLWGADKDLGFPILDIPLMTQDLEDPLTAVNVCSRKGRPGVGGGTLVPGDRRQTIIIQYIKHYFETENLSILVHCQMDFCIYWRFHVLCMF